MELKNVKTMARMIDRNLFQIGGTLDYSRITCAITRLADMIADCDGGEEIWWIELNSGSLDELIVGAYWHYSQWHGGQSSIGYAALSALGNIFSPGMGGEETNETSQELDNMAREYFKEGAA